MANPLESTAQDFIARSMKAGEDLFVVRVSALEEMQHLARETLLTAECESKEAYVAGYIEALGHILQAVYHMQNKARRRGRAGFVEFDCPE